MNQEQGSGDPFSSREINKLKTHFEIYKDKLSKEEINELIKKVKELLKGRDIVYELFKYCKQHYPDLIKVCKRLRARRLSELKQQITEPETATTIVAGGRLQVTGEVRPFAPQKQTIETTPTPGGLITEYKPTFEQRFKEGVRKGEGTTGGILLGTGLVGYRFGKGFVMGVTAPFRPKFYTEELPATYTVAKRIVTGQGVPELGEAIREDPTILAEFAGYGKGTKFLTKTVGKGVQAVKRFRFESKIKFKPSQKTPVLILKKSKSVKPALVEPKAKIPKGKQIAFRKDYAKSFKELGEPKLNLKSTKTAQTKLTKFGVKQPIKISKEITFAKTTESGRRLSMVPRESQYKFITPKKTAPTIGERISTIGKAKIPKTRRVALEKFLKSKRGTSQFLVKPTITPISTAIKKAEISISRTRTSFSTGTKGIFIPFISSLPRQQVGLGVSQIQRSSPQLVSIAKTGVRITPISKLTPLSRPIQKPLPRSGIVSITSSKITAIPLSTGSTITRPTPRRPTPPKLAPTRKIFRLPDPEFRRRLIPKRKKRKYPRREFLYTATIKEGQLGIRGKKTLSGGVGPRPLPRRRKRRRF